MRKVRMRRLQDKSSHSHFSHIQPPHLPHTRPSDRETGEKVECETSEVTDL